MSLFTPNISQCGRVLFNVVDSQGVSLLDPTHELFGFVQYEPSRGIEVLSDDMSLYGDYKIRIQGYLENYPTVQSSFV